MQNENVEKQNQIKKNPTRFNEKVNRGENEKSFDQENTSFGAGKNESKNTGSKDFVGGRGESGAGGAQNAQFSGGPEAGNYDDQEFQQKEQQQAQQQSGEPLGREKNEA